MCRLRQSDKVGQEIDFVNPTNTTKTVYFENLKINQSRHLEKIHKRRTVIKGRERNLRREKNPR